VNVIIHRLRSLTLAKQFFLAGGMVTLGAVLLVSVLVTHVVTQAVTKNAAATTALYVDSIIAPILPDLSSTEQLDGSVERALDETLAHGALGRRLVSFRLWRKDGRIIYSNDKGLQGLQVLPNADREEAFEGQLVANYESADDDEGMMERVAGGPFLEIYNPVLQPWSGEVVAVAEFYENAAEVKKSLTRVLLLTWLTIICVLAFFFLALSLIVVRGSSTIETQRLALRDRIQELDQLLRENTGLGERVRRASRQTAALNEQFLRKVGADIHDGPLQSIAYAAMCVDSPSIRYGNSQDVDRSNNVDAIKESLEDALNELRLICKGLVLPEIESLPIDRVLSHVVSNYRARTGSDVMLSTQASPIPITPSARICAYRFVQEALNNGWIHADGQGQFVRQFFVDRTLIIAVGDSGPGFDPDCVERGRMGLLGMRERLESIGGHLEVAPCSNGTVLTMRLPICDAEAV
jgi:signal transduction histidine kinase